MKTKLALILTIVFSLVISGFKIVDNTWLTEKSKNYNLLYTSADIKNLKEYKKLMDNGIVSVNNFFGATYNKSFDVIIHPNRHSLDSTWRKDWAMPDFKSECWMVASGIATKLDIISPITWDKEACEHIYSQTKKTQQLITHELVHVYHGQLNPSPDFSKVEGLDWFVEGLATFASGQCDLTRIVEIKNAISQNKIPDGLDNFWTGNLKYGLSGSVVMFIDKKYGRAKLKQLLPLTKKSDLLSVLKITETDL
ncbi:MAG TPA: hypothetical protein VNX01_12760, partial [Bacteroidia bacterium]|nr:hypothetical protein [Bacteroidia bacterium]